MLSTFLLLTALTAQPRSEAPAVAGPHVLVQGYGSVGTPPNVANITFEVRGEGKTSDEAARALVARSAAIERALRSIDGALELHSRSVRVEAVRGVGCATSEYDRSLKLSTGKCAIEGYVAAQDFSLSTSRVADAGTMVSLAGRHGAHAPRISSFDLADDKDAKRRAINAALADARTKAQAVAGGSGVALGPVISVSLDSARESQAILIGRLVPPQAERDEPVAISVAPAPVVTTSQVFVTYALAR